MNKLFWPLFVIITGTLFMNFVMTHFSEAMMIFSIGFILLITVGYFANLKKQ